MALFSARWLTILNQLRTVSFAILEILLPFVKMFVGPGGSVAIALAMKIVPAVEAALKESSGKEKQESAQKQIIDEAAKKGIELREALVNAAIEAAVAKMKADAAESELRAKQALDQLKKETPELAAIIDNSKEVV